MKRGTRRLYISVVLALLCSAVFATTAFGAPNEEVDSGERVATGTVDTIWHDGSINVGSLDSIVESTDTVSGDTINTENENKAILDIIKELEKWINLFLK